MSTMIPLPSLERNRNSFGLPVPVRVVFADIGVLDSSVAALERHLNAVVGEGLETDINGS